jgi:proteasome lid subunit RPN8/RPN11
MEGRVLIPVVISNYVLQKIRTEMNVPYEQIGLLIGELSNGQLMVTDAISGTSSASRSLSVLSPEVLAEVADDIVNNRIAGRIVGWYHSHLGSGLFMSPIDIETHSKLQQFSNQVIALIVDTSVNQFGIFTYDPQLGGLTQLPEEYITII